MNDRLHIYPRGDLFAHELAGDACPCGPTPELVETEQGDWWLIVHHSLDGREAVPVSRSSSGGV